MVTATLVLHAGPMRPFQSGGSSHFNSILVQDSPHLFSSNLSGWSHQELKQLAVCCFRHHGNGPRHGMTADPPFSVQDNSGHCYYEPAKQPPGDHVSSKIVRLKAPLALEQNHRCDSAQNSTSTSPYSLIDKA